MELNQDNILFTDLYYIIHVSVITVYCMMTERNDIVTKGTTQYIFVGLVKTAINKNVKITYRR
jgi:hypothetical protein